MNDIEALGGLLKRIGNYDKMSTFEGRLRLQKTVYLMEQAFNLNLGYGFSWYIRGPYSPLLAGRGFELRQAYDNLPIASFKDSAAENRFQEFLKFLGDRKDNADWLEIIASIHFLRTVHPSVSKDWILHKVKNKQHYFTLAQCSEAWDCLEKWRKI